MMSYSFIKAKDFLSRFYYLLLPLCAETEQLCFRIEASCKQQCNVVEQTPSRLRVADHSVCSIYQSADDNGIYEENKGSNWLRVNRESARKRVIPFYFTVFNDLRAKYESNTCMN